MPNTTNPNSLFPFSVADVYQSHIMSSYSAQGHPDHDACGTGFIVRLGDRGSHEVIERALSALQRLAHRGGVDADGSSGDGAGLMTAIPQAFIRRASENLGLVLPANFALGMLLLPAQEVSQVQRAMEKLAPE